MALPDFASRVCRPLGWACLLLGMAGLVHAQPQDDASRSAVTVVLSEDGGPYREFSDALDEFLAARNVHPRVIDAGQPLPTKGLIVAVGMKAAEAAADSDAPHVLDALVTRAGYQQLLRDFPERANSSVIYLDQPVRRAALLIAAALPGKRNVGLLYSDPPADLAAMKQEFRDRGLALQAQTVNAAHPLSNALQDVLGRSDVLLALPDTTVYNGSTIRNILLASYRSNVPLVGFSPGYVKAGALCAVFSTPRQIARQAAAMILQFDDTHALPLPQYPREFEVMVNEQVARSLGLQVRSATALYEEIVSEVREIQ